MRLLRFARNDGILEFLSAKSHKPYKITIAKDVSDMKDFEVYQVMLSDRLTTAKELAEHFLNVWAANAGKVA